MDTKDASYARRLAHLESAWWKRAFDVQAPYRFHLRRLGLGFVLDVGCGLGRNLVNLGKGCGVGVDHNVQAVCAARDRGVDAFTIEEFRASQYARPDAFDAILVSHVVEHMRRSDAVGLLVEYTRFLRPGGKVVMITPQESGFRSDPTHVHFVDFDEAAAILDEARLERFKQYSFPLPRALGGLFKYNEFVTIGSKPGKHPAAGGNVHAVRPNRAFADREADA